MGVCSHIVKFSTALVASLCSKPISERVLSKGSVSGFGIIYCGIESHEGFGLGTSPEQVCVYYLRNPFGRALIRLWPQSLRICRTLYDHFRIHILIRFGLPLKW